MADLALFVVEAPLMTTLGGRPLFTGVFSSKMTAPRVPTEVVAAALLPRMRRTVPPLFRWSIDAWLSVGLIRGEVLLFFWKLRKFHKRFGEAKQDFTPRHNCVSCERSC